MNEPCPKCLERIPYGGGVRRHGARFHFWCAKDAEPVAEKETRLPSGATV